jgi:hypothetical protein
MHSIRMNRARRRVFAGVLNFDWDIVLLHA